MQKEARAPADWPALRYEKTTTSLSSREVARGDTVNAPDLCQRFI